VELGGGQYPDSELYSLVYYLAGVSHNNASGTDENPESGCCLASGGSDSFLPGFERSRINNNDTGDMI
jgi:hypothetical protein